MSETNKRLFQEFIDMDELDPFVCAVISGMLAAGYFIDPETGRADVNKLIDKSYKIASQCLIKKHFIAESAIRNNSNIHNEIMGLQ